MRSRPRPGPSRVNWTHRDRLAPAGRGSKDGIRHEPRAVEAYRRPRPVPGRSGRPPAATGNVRFRPSGRAAHEPLLGPPDRGQLSRPRRTAHGRQHDPGPLDRRRSGGAWTRCIQRRPRTSSSRSDLMWYPVEGNNRRRLAPDGMVAFGRPKGNRKLVRPAPSKAAIPPQVVFEVLSPGNRKRAMDYKRKIYETDTGSRNTTSSTPTRSRSRSEVWLREGETLSGRSRPTRRRAGSARGWASGSSWART